MYLFYIFGLHVFGGNWITIREPFVVTISKFENKRESSAGGRIQIISKLLTSRVRHPSIFFNYRHVGGFLLGTIIYSNNVPVQA